MRLLYVCADPGIPLDGVKGASVHVRQTVESLARQGVEVTVAALRPGEYRPEGVRVLPPPERPARRKRSGPVFDELERQAAALRLAAGVLDRSVSVDAVYERYSLWSLAGVAIADTMGVPLVLEVNAPLVDEQRRYRRLTLEPVARGIEALLARRADLLLCVSSPLCRRFERLRGFGEGVRHFPNRVDVRRFRPAGPVLGRKPITAIFTGSLKPWHGLGTLVDSAALLKSRGRRIRTVIVGDGPERASLEARCAAAGLEGRVVFTGAVGHDRIPDLLSSADVGLAPYPALDGFYFSPLKVAEYMAAGLPVVASAVGDLAGSLRDGETALLVPPGDPAALADALERLDDDDALRTRLGVSARAWAESRLDLDRGTQELLDWILEACGGEVRPWHRRCPA